MRASSDAEHGRIRPSPPVPVSRVMETTLRIRVSTWMSCRLPAGAFLKREHGPSPNSLRASMPRTSKRPGTHSRSPRSNVHHRSRPRSPSTGLWEQYPGYAGTSLSDSQRLHVHDAVRNERRTPHAPRSTSSMQAFRLKVPCAGSVAKGGLHELMADEGRFRGNVVPGEESHDVWRHRTML